MVSSNTYHNIAAISAAALDVVRNNVNFSKTVTRDYDGTWSGAGAKQGDTFNIRIPGVAQYRSGSVAAPSPYSDSYVPVTLVQGGCDMQFNEKDLVLNIDDFKQNVLAPMLAPVINKIDTTGLALLTGLNQWAGTQGTMPTNMQPFLQARSILEKQSGVTLDGDIYALIDGDQQATTLTGMGSWLNPVSKISKNYEDGFLGDFGGMHVFSTANAPATTAGTWATGSPTYTSGATDGGTSIVTGSWGAGSLAVGDLFTIANVYAVNPVSGASTSQLKQFTVTAPVTISAGNATIAFSPAMILTASANGAQNISALPTASAAIYTYGNATANKNTGMAANTMISNSLVYHKNAFVLAMASMPNVDAPNTACSRMKDPLSGFDLRLVKYFDGVNGKQLYRLDVLYGWNILRQGFGARVIA